ncbi:12134_t:CDS:1 [Ambispora gerdemannii]|uniref:UDP-galactose transporter homolog 1 n=1 Tax=Ambispora gerdemannii TaxID=144530 RepID=A0A9N8V3Z1_9GLOM|nr:12134_t:CDS:1 [Ambispora gerdemannii]
MSLIKVIFSITGIYVCFLTWGVLQERVSTTPYNKISNNDNDDPSLKPQRFRYFIFLNMFQSFTASIVALFHLIGTGNKDILINNFKDPHLLLRYLQVAFIQTIGSPFGYQSLKHIDYPTMILGKSCKLVPVMLMNFLLYRKKFPLYKYVVVFLITLGVSGFMLLQPVSEKKRGASSNSIYGILLLSVSLLMDGVTNATQDQIFHKYKVTGQQMMLSMNLFSGTLMFGWLLIPWNLELGNAVAFCLEYPAVIKDIMLFSLCGALGQCFIFYSLQTFGSFFLVTVTVTRKLFTMLLSVFWFDHRLSFGQWVAVACVFLGIALEAFVKQMEKRRLEKNFEMKEKEKGLSNKNGYHKKQSSSENTKIDKSWKEKNKQS